MKTVKQEALQQAIENLSIILQDEDLTDEKLREYSEGLLPNTQDLLIKALNQDDWIRIESEEDLPNNAGYCDCIIDGELSEVCFYWESEQSFTDAAGHMVKPSHYIMKTKPALPIY